MPGDDNGWYSDREMFEMINGLKLELVKTQEHIKKYNGLLEQFKDVDERISVVEGEVNTIKTDQQSRKLTKPHWAQFWVTFGALFIAVISLALSLIHS